MGPELCCLERTGDSLDVWGWGEKWVSAFKHFQFCRQKAEDRRFRNAGEDSEFGIGLRESGTLSTSAFSLGNHRQLCVHCVYSSTGVDARLDQSGIVLHVKISESNSVSAVLEQVLGEAQSMDLNNIDAISRSFSAVASPSYHTRQGLDGVQFLHPCHSVNDQKHREPGTTKSSPLDNTASQVHPSRPPCSLPYVSNKKRCLQHHV